MEYLVIMMSIVGAILGLATGIFIGSHKNIEKDHKGVLFIDRIDKEPYVAGCWLGIEDEKDLKNLRSGEKVLFTVHINYVKDSDPYRHSICIED